MNNLAKDEIYYVREQVCKNPKVSDKILLFLSKDENNFVKEAANSVIRKKENKKIVQSEINF